MFIDHYIIISPKLGVVLGFVRFTLHLFYQKICQLFFAHIVKFYIHFNPQRCNGLGHFIFTLWPSGTFSHSSNNRQNKNIWEYAQPVQSHNIRTHLKKKQRKFHPRKESHKMLNHKKQLLKQYSLQILEESNVTEASSSEKNQQQQDKNQQEIICQLTMQRNLLVNI